MKLEEILVKHAVAWPKDAEWAYQSLLDSEVYFTDRYTGTVSRTRRNPLPYADKRGVRNKISVRDYQNFLDGQAFKTRVLSAGGITAMKEQERQRSIQRIENGLRKDFDIDSPALAIEMFNKGWRR